MYLQLGETNPLSAPLYGLRQQLVDVYRVNGFDEYYGALLTRPAQGAPKKKTFRGVRTNFSSMRNTDFQP